MTSAIILQLRDEVKKNGSEFAVVSLTNAPQVHTRQQQQLNRADGLQLDYDKPDRMIEELAAAHGIPMLTLVPPFRAYHMASGEILHAYLSEPCPRGTGTPPAIVWRRRRLPSFSVQRSC